jgi:hypothetical protein
MSLSRFLSITSAALASLGGGCSDDSCGTHGAPASGLVASSDQVTLTFGNLSALPGNDCPSPGTPSGVISLSLEGTQTDGTGLITICIPRPDLLDDGNRAIGTATSTAELRMIDLRGSYQNCTYTIDSTQPATGTGGSEGVCANGTDAAGFALQLDGSLSLRRTCGATIDTIAVALTGRVAVTKRQ